MSKKKPASLSESLLTNRPRKGQAKPQSEAQAARPQLAVVEPAEAERVQPTGPAHSVEPAAAPATQPRRGRKRVTAFSAQMNLKVRPADRDRFIEAAESADLTNGAFFTMLLDRYEENTDI